MAMIKHPYELSVWKEYLGEKGTKIEEKGAIIGAHDMTYLGKATQLQLTRKSNGTNVLTFTMPSLYYDPIVGDYIHNDYIDILYTECKLKFYYKKKWYEFYIKKRDEKKQGKALWVSFTCQDAFIDELSRNGYGITFDTELYNNVEEIGTFTNKTLKDSVWKYHPENNWGDFTEFKEEKLYRIPVSQFKKLTGYKLNFDLTREQFDMIGTEEIENLYTKESRTIEISDDLAAKCFWNQYNENGEIINKIDATLVEDIPNDGYIYIPYSSLSFCYGQPTPPNYNEKIKADATDIALTDDNNNLLLVPQSVNPNTIIQFIAFPENTVLEMDESGLILNTEYIYFITLDDWNNLLKTNTWYIFEDTRVVKGETIGINIDSVISHTYKYKTTITDDNSLLKFQGNKTVIYDGYLSDLNDKSIIKGKKISIANRSEINISEEIDQYTTVYNNDTDDFIGLYSNDENWTYEDVNESTTTSGEKYRICSKIATRQIIPQMARNLIQNGIKIKSTDGWELINYIVNDTDISSGVIELRTLEVDSQINNAAAVSHLKNSALFYAPPRKSLGIVYEASDGMKFIRRGKDQYWIVNRDDLGNPMLIKADNYITGESEQITEYVYPTIDKNEDENIINYSIKWYENWDLHQIPVDRDSFGVINFGIVGQEQQIKKDKIYCLGLSGIFETNENFKILIAPGSLVSQGTYSIDESETTTNTFKWSDIFDSEDYLNADQSFWNKIENGKESISLEAPTPSFILFKAKATIDNPYFVIKTTKRAFLIEAYLFEAYTKGKDCFAEDKDKKLIYSYSGRDLFGCEVPTSGGSWNNNHSPIFTKDEIKKIVIFEDDIMLGTTYEYQQYYIQRLAAKVIEDNEVKVSYYDTMGQSSFLSNDSEQLTDDLHLPLDESKYTEDDYEIQTNYINMNKCSYYKLNNQPFDCTYGNKNSICFYQKYGYCPYRFTPEQHCRKIRTLSVQKSNRFNIIQSLSKVFEAYPQFYIEHKESGDVVQDSSNNYEKRVFYVREKGKENQIGFRYGKNLKDISRTINSEQIVSKLYVLDVDSELSKTGMCSIKMAEDNPSKDSFIIDFSYYVAKNILSEDDINQDLYGLYPAQEGEVSGYLKQLGYYNGQYDILSNKIINLQDASYTELEANLNVNLLGIVAAQKELLKLVKQLDAYKGRLSDSNSQIYQSYRVKILEQESILTMLVNSTFFTDEQPSTNAMLYSIDGINTDKMNSVLQQTNINVMDWFDCIEDLEKVKKIWVDKHLYDKGILGQFNQEYIQIQSWKKERSKYLKLINKLSSDFYKKYEPYLKEGTWSDSNYLSDNAYYFGALDVAAEGAIPKVSYNISVIDISGLSEENEEIYNFDLYDTTWVEDEEMFGVNLLTGLPNRLKVLVSEVVENPDDESKNNIKVQNFTTQFEDLFQQVSASVQSLTFNENVYKRSSNFTALQSIKTNSLQGALSQNNLTLLNTDEDNIKVDNSGTSGSDINNHVNKYKLDGQGMSFSNNGGQSYNVGVGPSGINADYIKVGMIDTSKIRIADSAYVYFTWDKSGIVAYRDPAGVNTTNIDATDCVIFNKYGLSVAKNGHIKLRAGYDFSETNGKIDNETQQGENIGFYLYNDDGKKIFVAEGGDETGGAQIRLVGEMAVFDSTDSTYVENNYKYYQRKDIKQVLAYEYGDMEPLWQISPPADSSSPEIIADTYLITKYGLCKLDTVQVYTDTSDVDHYWYKSGNYYIEVVGEATFISIFTGSNNSAQTELMYELPMETLEYYSLENRLFTDYALYYLKDAPGTYYIEEDKCWKEVVPPTEYYESGQIGLFLNNPALTQGNINGQERLFVCCHEVNSEIRNILSVLKNGNLYIGGTIVNSGLNLHSLSPEITVENAGIEITTNGKLKIDFNNFENGEQSIIQYVNKAVEDKVGVSHQHMLDPECGNIEVKETFHFDYSTGDKLDALIEALNDAGIPIKLELNGYTGYTAGG